MKIFKKFVFYCLLETNIFICKKGTYNNLFMAQKKNGPVDQNVNCDTTTVNVRSMTKKVGVRVTKVAAGPAHIHGQNKHSVCGLPITTPFVRQKSHLNGNFEVIVHK